MTEKARQRAADRRRAAHQRKVQRIRNNTRKPGSDSGGLFSCAVLVVLALAISVALPVVWAVLA